MIQELQYKVYYDGGSSIVYRTTLAIPNEIIFIGTDQQCNDYLSSIGVTKFTVLTEKISTTAQEQAFLNASDVVNTPSGNISSDNVQDAINELDSEKVPNTRNITINGTTHDLSADRSWTVGGAGSDITAIHTNIAAEIDGLTAKDTVIDGDEIVLEDSASSPTVFGKKKVSFLNLWTNFFKGKADTNYLKLDQTTPQTISNGIPLLNTDVANFNANHQIVDKEYVDTRPMGGTKSWYFTGDASNVGGLLSATTTFPNATLQTISATANNGETTIAQFLTEPQTKAYNVLDGMRFFYFTARVSNVAKTTQLRGEVWTCDATGGSQVLLRTSSLTIPLTLVNAEYSTSAYGGALYIPTTTRIIFKVIAVKETGGTLPTVTLSVNDDTFSRLDVPSPVGVTDISGLIKLDQTVSQTIVNGQPIQDILTASQIVATDANKKLQTLAVATYPSLTELAYVKGVTSGIQGQINGKQATITTGTTSQYFRGDLSLATFPSIPAAQIQSDWNQSNNALLDYIKNKPSIPAAQVNSDWNAVSGLAQILNKPTIPTVGTWGVLNYPTYASGTPFVKMTAAGTFALDTNTYLTSLSGAVLTDQTSGQTIGATSARLTKLWVTDITCTNAITGSVTGNAGGSSASCTGNAATVTNATFTTALTVNTGSVTLTGNAANTSVLTIGAGAVSVSGSNTGDNAANSSTMYIGTTAVALNRTSATLALTGITSITPATDSTTAFQILKQSDSTIVFNVDTINKLVDIRGASPRFNVTGSVEPSMHMSRTGGADLGFYGEIGWGEFGTYSNHYLKMMVNNTEIVRVNSGGIAIKLVNTATAYCHIAAGTIVAGTASLKIDSTGTGLTGLLATPEAGAIERSSYGLWITPSTVRHKFWEGLIGQTAPTTNSGSVFTNYFGANITNVLGTPITWISITGDDGNVYKLPAYS